MNKTSELDIKVLKEDIDKTSFIGEVKSGFLTEAQVQAQVGLGWILSDGRDVTGSTYETITGNTNVPDMRDQFLRGKSATRALGSAQDDAFQGHRHDNGVGQFGNPSNNDKQFYDATHGPDKQTPNAGWVPYANWRGNTGDATATDHTNGTPRTASETRPKNIAVNYFIRIN